MAGTDETIPLYAGSRLQLMPCTSFAVKGVECPNQCRSCAITARGASQGQRQLLVGAACRSTGFGAVHHHGFLQYRLQRNQ